METCPPNIFFMRPPPAEMCESASGVRSPCTCQGLDAITASIDNVVTDWPGMLVTQEAQP